MISKQFNATIVTLASNNLIIGDRNTFEMEHTSVAAHLIFWFAWARNFVKKKLTIIDEMYPPFRYKAS